MFGIIGWGKGSWGAVAKGQISSDFRRPDSGNRFGSSIGLGKADPELYITAREFENAVKFGDPTAGVTASHVKAFLATLSAGQGFGRPAAEELVLKSKTWAEALPLYSRQQERSPCQGAKKNKEQSAKLLRIRSEGSEFPVH